MSKQITITGVNLKEFNASKIDGKINIRAVYSLLDENGKEYDQKADSIKDDDLTNKQKGYVNDLMTDIETKLKVKENI